SSRRRECSPLKSEMQSTPSSTASPSTTNEVHLVPQRGFHDQRVTIAPVIAVSGEQPNALALALDDQAIAVVLDLMKPVRPGRNLLPRVGMQGSYSYWRMAP